MVNSAVFHFILGPIFSAAQTPRSPPSSVGPLDAVIAGLRRRFRDARPAAPAGRRRNRRPRAARQAGRQRHGGRGRRDRGGPPRRRRGAASSVERGRASPCRPVAWPRAPARRAPSGSTATWRARRSGRGRRVGRAVRPPTWRRGGPARGRPGQTRRLDRTRPAECRWRRRAAKFAARPRENPRGQQVRANAVNRDSGVSTRRRPDSSAPTPGRPAPARRECAVTRLSTPDLVPGTIVVERPTLISSWRISERKPGI